ncbi:MAG: glycosyltransferase family A protein [Bacteroidota bacterium]|nr:glycosyltransferase family A protein [Bacteroidota bacterium]
MQDALSVTAVIINYKTLDLTQKAIESFRLYYPSIPFLLIDNGSNDESTTFLIKYHETNSQTTDIILNEKNTHHGPAMNMALHKLKSSLVLFIDSDCEVNTGGFLERMVSLLEENPKNYIVGKIIYMNKRGFDTENRSGAISYIRPYCMLIRRNLYFEFPKFTRHGTPCLKNMETAATHGFNLIDFPTENYIYHRGRGTAERYGYQLGWRGKLNYLLNKFGL